MKPGKRRLPSLNAMLAFEAAARHGSFTRAAEELFLSQSVVSRHVASLEDHVGVSLFERQGNLLRLTGQGAELANVIARALDEIGNGIRRIQSRDHALGIACSHDFAQTWLMPRFGLLSSLAPQRQIRLLTSDDYEDFNAPDIQLSFRIGRPGQWPGFRAHLLFGLEVFPACAPEYLARHPFLAGGERSAFLRARLLHVTHDISETYGWNRWIGVPEPLPGPTFTSYTAVLHEAIAGRGVALAISGVVDDHIDGGRLVKIGTGSDRLEESAYVVVREDCEGWVATLAARLIGG